MNGAALDRAAALIALGRARAVAAGAGMDVGTRLPASRSSRSTDAAAP